MVEGVPEPGPVGYILGANGGVAGVPSAGRRQAGLFVFGHIQAQHVLLGHHEERRERRLVPIGRT